jgi:hypothetical protein
MISPSLSIFSIPHFVRSFPVPPTPGFLCHFSYTPTPITMHHFAVAYAALAAVVAANPAPVPQLDLAQLLAAPPVPQGPDPIGDADGKETATLFTSMAITGVAIAQATGNVRKREWQDNDYAPYYPALATGYTTDPALTASSTTTANQPCVTQPEAGTYCGFINPLDPCAPQPDGYGPVPSPDTASAFLGFSKLHEAAQSAPTEVPSKDGTQYNQVFKDLDGQVSGSSYLRLFTLKSYSVPDCAARCDATDLCTSFVSVQHASEYIRADRHRRTFSPSATLRSTQPTTTPTMIRVTQRYGDKTARR